MTKTNTRVHIPRDIQGATREQLTALGFRFGADVDGVFVACELPQGWSMRDTHNPLVVNLLDEQGRKRARVYHKFCHSHRGADMTMEPRYNVAPYSVSNGCSKTRRHFTAADCGRTLKDFGGVECDDWEGMDLLENTAKAWLTARYPNWQNPLAYW